MFTKKIVMLFALALFALISAASEIEAQQVTATVKVMSITVDAVSEQVDTGITVMPGDKLEFAVKGQTQHGEKVSWTYEGDKNKGDANGQFTFKKANQFALVGWVGSKNNFFQVSKITNPYANDKSGTLFFAINDWSGKHYENNVGGLTVDVTLIRTYEIKGDDAKAVWGNGLIMINKDDKLAVAANGKVTYWEGGDPRDANGKVGKMNTLLAPQIDQSALIGKIGDNGNPFKVGTNYPGSKMNESGWLYLTVNDEIKKTGAFNNNSGKLDILVAVERPMKPFRNPIK